MATRLGSVALIFLIAISLRADDAGSVTAKPAPEWDAKFAGTEGWIGGDGLASAVLGPERVLWLFGDSLMGKVKDGGRPGAVMVNNMVAVQTGLDKDATLRFVAGKAKDGKPASLFTPEDGRGWFWPQSALHIDRRLFLFMPQIEKTKEGDAFGFKHVGQWLLVVDNPDDDPLAWRIRQHKLPFVVFEAKRERSWGSALLRQGEDVFIFGYDEQGKGLGRRHLTVARVPAGKLDDFAAWRFRTADGWSEHAAEAAPLAAGLGTEFSVTPPGGKGFIVVYTENGLGDRIVARLADAPEGPWAPASLLYRGPEMAKDKGVFTYAAKAHPWGATDTTLLISYCVNTWDFGRLFRDAGTYRPKFVRVVLGR